jgi:membrane protease YdiL (CAAX protease family)
MMGAIEARFGRWAGVLGSALVFGLVHIESAATAIWNFLPLFAGGCGFAFMYSKYRDISLNFVAHATWNSIAVILMFATRGLPN